MNDLALYTHCMSHTLTLCVTASCSIQSVKLIMEKMQEIIVFFERSPKRQRLLESVVKKHIHIVSAQH